MPPLWRLASGTGSVPSLTRLDNPHILISAIIVSPLNFSNVVMKVSCVPAMIVPIGGSKPLILLSALNIRHCFNCSSFGLCFARKIAYSD